jgi:hypothetical protein
MAIDHLSDLSTSLRHQKQGEAAQRVVSWISEVLDAIGASGEISRGTHTKEELARLQHGLLLTNRVEINSMNKRRIPEQVIRAKRKFSLVILENWQVALNTTSWEALEEHAQEVKGTFFTLRLTPMEVEFASPVAAFFGERTNYLQTSVINPTIFAYRTVKPSQRSFKS